ncbi:hypothetical protein [Ideonella livida]|uniref:Uncharacterized protein n=1 Tax=Ideonella livida TaxID=2707176 RepID=A0A7C9PH46_9BURK|nr:hypothetical protein [Ideonella livida]NDY91795.1 hypothetical protein [Ideonella livida]
MPTAHGNWFTQLTGWAESDYASTQARLLNQVEDGRWLRHAGTGRRVDMGVLRLPTLQQLRQEMAAAGHPPAPRPLRVTVQRGDAISLHQDPTLAGALIQAASQFNLLEMTGPERTPEHGITAYLHDPTQGPACAMACGGGTVWRNYLVPLDDFGDLRTPESDDAPRGCRGQTQAQQLDALAGLHAALQQVQDRPGAAPGPRLWTLRNGYALFGPGQVQAVAELLRRFDEPALDRLRGALAIGWHQHLDVTALPLPWPATLPQVCQAYCSALPVAYNRRADATLADWEPLARLVLDASYEATLRAATLQARAGGSATVVLTLVGGGVFGNPRPWILAAIDRALQAVAGEGLDVRINSFGPPPQDLLDLVGRWQRH